MARSSGLGGYEHTHTLTSSKIDQVRGFLLGVNAVNLDDSHVMLVELDQERGEIGHVDDSDHVGLARGDREACSRSVIENSRVGDWLRAGRVELWR